MREPVVPPDLQSMRMIRMMMQRRRVEYQQRPQQLLQPLREKDSLLFVKQGWVSPMLTLLMLLLWMKC